MHEHGNYFRTPVLKKRRVKLPIYRWYCPRCKQTLTVLPNFLVPGGHFVTQVRETAILRRRCGKSFKRIAEGIASKTVGGVSMDTVKRWWRRHLEKAGEVAQWVAAELIRAGVKDDLLRLHFKGVNLTAVDTANWLFMLFKRFFNRQQPPIHGFFSSLNFRLPAELWL